MQQGEKMQNMIENIRIICQIIDYLWKILTITREAM